METGHAALILFYAFFWQHALGMTARYQGFDTPSMWAGEKRVLRRGAWAFVFLNLLPIVWLLVLYKWFIPAGQGLLVIAGAACGGLSVFGFHRILHAIIATDGRYRHYYTDTEIKSVRLRDGFNQPQDFVSHFWPGVSYLALYGALAWILPRLA